MKSLGMVSATSYQASWERVKIILYIQTPSFISEVAEIAESLVFYWPLQHFFYGLWAEA
jgi:hypothetical protein